ncbi:MAG: endonuclease/exonuclease/phosphatase family protein [Candidatus Andeanibacterium colombiense]|uniref:Endonuclease/exonuclease/phosphatase family protein n=1 Tax=Candidatus Andeanibacterium colombiense TaxID=3121345 RepID=A0AAJ6BR68_9SPHN|nr:MAG: endonuclease/exonuclease/phosphatase family protein [Sphingomonadaceae bacterium]
MELKFASYNIHKAVGTDGRRDPDRILAVLRELDADIVALQEVDRRLGRRESVLSRLHVEEQGYQIVGCAVRPDSMGWHGNAILVRRGIAVAGSAPLHLPVLEPRGAVRAELRHDDAPLRVVGMHLDLSGLRRRDQLRTVTRELAGCEPPCPTVLLGDFNQWSARGSMREFRDGWQALAPGKSFPSRQPLAPLDRIVLSREWEPKGMGVHHSALAASASDHLPIWAVASV